jgi:hypothetical protein
MIVIYQQSAGFHQARAFNKRPLSLLYSHDHFTSKPSRVSLLAVPPADDSSKQIQICRDNQISSWDPQCLLILRAKNILELLRCYQKGSQSASQLASFTNPKRSLLNLTTIYRKPANLLRHLKPSFTLRKCDPATSTTHHDPETSQ